MTTRSLVSSTTTDCVKIKNAILDVEKFTKNQKSKRYAKIKIVNLIAENLTNAQKETSVQKKQKETAYMKSTSEEVSE